jgi:hypothetical protein
LIACLIFACLDHVRLVGSLAAPVIERRCSLRVGEAQSRIHEPSTISKTSLLFDMSGLEIVAVAASVLQLADLGGRLSVKLFTFSRKIKNADKSIASISAEIAQTGSILQLLGNELQKDDQLKVCSAEAVAKAKVLVSDCYKLFDDLNESLDAKAPKNKVVAAWKQRIKFALVEPQIDLLKTNWNGLRVLSWSC